MAKETWRPIFEIEIEIEIRDQENDSPNDIGCESKLSYNSRRSSLCGDGLRADRI